VLPTERGFSVGSKRSHPIERQTWNPRVRVFEMTRKATTLNRYEDCRWVILGHSLSRVLVFPATAGADRFNLVFRCRPRLHAGCVYLGRGSRYI
jgi:hypothetical protein